MLQIRVFYQHAEQNFGYYPPEESDPYYNYNSYDAYGSSNGPQQYSYLDSVSAQLLLVIILTVNILATFKNVRIHSLRRSVNPIDSYFQFWDEIEKNTYSTSR